MIKLNEQTTEFKELEKEWYKEIDTLTTKSKYNNYVKKLLGAYEHDFGTSLRALACIVNATIRFYSGGLHPIQANYLMWLIIRNTFGYKDEIGLKITGFQEILQPTFKNKISVSKEAHERIIELAKTYLTTCDDEKVKKHLEKIVSGWLPSYCELEESEVKA